MPINRITLHYARGTGQPEAAAKAKISIYVQARYISMTFHNSADNLTPGQQLVLEDQSAKQHTGSSSLSSSSTEATLKLDGSITDYVQVWSKQGSGMSCQTLLNLPEQPEEREWECRLSEIASGKQEKSLPPGSARRLISNWSLHSLISFGKHPWKMRMSLKRRSLPSQSTLPHTCHQVESQR